MMKSKHWKKKNRLIRYILLRFIFPIFQSGLEQGRRYFITTTLPHRDNRKTILRNKQNFEAIQKFKKLRERYLLFGEGEVEISMLVDSIKRLEEGPDGSGHYRGAMRMRGSRADRDKKKIIEPVRGENSKLTACHGNTRGRRTLP